MKTIEILKAVTSLKCARCGGTRHITWWWKLVLRLLVWSLRRQGKNDEQIIAYLNRALNNSCLE